MKPIFIQSEHQHIFDKSGYIILPFLQPDQIRALTEFYHNFVHGPDKGPVWDSSRFNDHQANDKISHEIYSAFSDSVDKYFQNHTFYGGTYLVKPTTDSSLLPLHQDWNIIDENRFTSAQIWCPLTDIENVNGSLFVIDGSHTFYKTYRSGSIHGLRFDPSENESIHRQIKDVPVKAGSAVIYKNNLFHGSYPNSAAADRIVALGSIMSKEAQLIYYQRSEDGNSILKVKASPEFYLKHIGYLTESRLPPDAEVLETIPQAPKILTIADIAACMDQSEPVAGRKFSLLKNWFGKFMYSSSRPES